MNKKAFIVLALSAMACTASMAAEPYHIVEKGDTLWDISDDAWNDNFKWPVLWSLNPQFTNPHWINPGDPIYLDRTAPAPEKRVVRLPVERLSPPDDYFEGLFADGEGKNGSEEDLKNGDDASADILRKIKLAREQGLDFISPNKIARLATVSNVLKKKTAYVAGEEIELRIQTKTSLVEGELYTVFDDSSPMMHPSFEDPIGFMVKVLGQLKVVSVNGDMAVGHLVETYDIVEDGAGLMGYFAPLEEISLRQASVDLKGKIIGGRQGKTIFAENDIVFLDKGSVFGLGRGVVLDVPLPKDNGSADGSVTDLQAPLARLVVLSVQDNTASGIIVKNRGVVEVGDIFASSENPLY